MFVSAIAVLLGVGCSGDVEVRDASGRVIAAGPWSVFDLRVGDCIGDASVLSGDVSEVPLVPCDEPHTMAVVAVVDHPDTAFPGVAEVAAFADRSCSEELESVLGAAFASATFSYLLPTEAGWVAGDRSVVCVLVRDAG
jgi:hypothetical protein